MNTGSWIFDFELDFAGTLNCIPMCVRLKLDVCGVKLSLKQWNRLPKEVRFRLVEAPCDTSEQISQYRADVVLAVECHTRLAAKFIEDPITAEWSKDNAVPSQIVSYSAAQGVAPPSQEAWARLQPLQRFALCKLTRPGHGNANFLAALREFGIAE